MGVEERIDHIESNIDRHKTDIWKALNTLTKDVSKISESVAVSNNTVVMLTKRQESISFPCHHGTQLRTDFDSHLSDEKINERDWKTFAFQIVAGIIIALATIAASTVIGYSMGKNSKVMIEKASSK